MVSTQAYTDGFDANLYWWFQLKPTLMGSIQTYTDWIQLKPTLIDVNLNLLWLVSIQTYTDW
jgi:hypothetical protein